MDKIVHFDVPVNDPEKAKAFYEKVFGWQIAEVPNMNYWMITTTESGEDRMPKEPGAINGGMYKRDQEGDVAVVVVNVPDVDERLKQAEEAGATLVMPKTEVGDMGWYARIKDPEGNVIGVWQDKPKA